MPTWSSGRRDVIESRSSFGFISTLPGIACEAVFAGSSRPRVGDARRLAPPRRIRVAVERREVQRRQCMAANDHTVDGDMW